MPETAKNPIWFGRFGKVDVLLLATAIFWGGSYLAAKDLTEHASVNSILAFRFTAAAVIMTLIFLAPGNKISRADWMLGALYGVQQKLLTASEWGRLLTSWLPLSFVERAIFTLVPCSKT